MALNLREVHKFDKVPGKPDTFRLSKVSPAMRLASEDQHLFIQHGRVYDEAGTPIKQSDLPGWFLEQVEKCTPAALAECGYSKPEPKAKKAA
jgi:hypothetical protein